MRDGNFVQGSRSEDVTASAVLKFSLALFEATELRMLAEVCVLEFTQRFAASRALIRDGSRTWCERRRDSPKASVVMVFRLTPAAEPPVHLELEVEASPDVPILRQQFLELIALVRRAWIKQSSIEHAQVLAHRDALTGLDNRRGIEAYLERALRDARQRERPLTLMLVDLDHFKAINDSEGHPAGDDVLLAAAACFREHLRPADRVCRWGGDEFVLVLPGLPADAGVGVANRLRRAFERLPRARGSTMSIGLVEHSDIGAEDAASLIAAADACLYAAKRAGRNRVHQRTPRKLAIEVAG